METTPPTTNEEKKSSGDFDINKGINELRSDPLLDYIEKPTERTSKASSKPEFEKKTEEKPATSDGNKTPSTPSSEFDKQPQEGEKKEPAKRRVKWERRSDTIVDIVDQVQKELNPLLYDLAAFTKQERQDLKRIIRDRNQAKKKSPGETVVGTEYEETLLDKAQDQIAYEEGLELDKDEKKDLSDALHEVLKELDHTPSPGTALMWTAVIIFLPRILPILMLLLPKLKKWFGLPEDDETPREFSFEQPSEKKEAA